MKRISSIFLFLSLLSLISCNGPDPKPELKDKIYQDMAQQKDQATKDLDAALKKLESSTVDLSKVAPQTGQIKFAEKRIWESQKVVDNLKQQVKYWTIRLDQRRNFVRQMALKSHQSGEPWENSAEVESYLTEKRLRMAKLDWDARSRRQEYLRSNGFSSESTPKAKKQEAAAH